MHPLRTLSMAVAAVVVLAVAGCGSANLRDSERLALYRGNAGEAVDSITYLGRLHGWTPLGDRALAIWTRPAEAYLLELAGPCQDLEFAQSIGLSSISGRVHARFDKVLVHSAIGNAMPCHIDTIRPLDVTTLRASEKQLRQARAEERQAD